MRGAFEKGVINVVPILYLWLVSYASLHFFMSFLRSYVDGFYLFGQNV